MLGMFRKRCVFGFVGFNPELLRELVKLHASTPDVDLQTYESLELLIERWRTLPVSGLRAVYLNADTPHFEMGFLHMSAQQPQVSVVAVTTQNDSQRVARLYRLGVKDVVVNPVSALCFAESMRWLMHASSNKPAEQSVLSRHDLSLALTPKQRLVFEKIVQDKTTREIAEELDLTESTVKLHKRNIYIRLKVRSTVGLMHRFYGHKLDVHYG